MGPCFLYTVLRQLQLWECIKQHGNMLLKRELQLLGCSIQLSCTFDMLTRLISLFSRLSLLRMEPENKATGGCARDTLPVWRKSCGLYHCEIMAGEVGIVCLHYCIFQTALIILEVIHMPDKVWEWEQNRTTRVHSLKQIEWEKRAPDVYCLHMCQISMQALFIYLGTAGARWSLYSV